MSHLTNLIRFRKSRSMIYQAMYDSGRFRKLYIAVENTLLAFLIFETDFQIE